MSNIPATLHYTKTHEWVMEEEGIYTLGITDHAQTMLGDLVYVELPSVETNLEPGQECAVVESVKAAADVYAPIAGEVLEINEELIENPQLINQDPYGKGWLIKVRAHEGVELKLLNQNEYSKLVASEAH